MAIELFLPAETDTARLGAVIAKYFPRSPVVYLKGELGAGKSALARAAIQSIGYQGAVKSPTYTLLELHEHNGLTILHWDLYRLSDPEELEYLGVRELTRAPAVWLVEWPEQGAGELPAADLVVELTVCGDGRLASLKAASALGREIAGQARNDRRRPQ